ncbi:radial spokehead-like protein [Dunaliella salina]|uniref:Radial spokehead-like protein n=1 Tax=Dunaliella salina TaxID=3046 RepID=A0ABQ7H8R4_DUNSA|nr:radial spokehead-like protein [Dunaliella salina]|eukprot:KAF5843246.1 radial spokehead-like protein [Dunaliella salina]
MADADAIAFLQKQTTADGTSLYGHLTRVLSKVLGEKPNEAVDLLETSLLVKKTAFEAQESAPLVPVSATADAAKTVATATLFGNPDLPIDPETGEPIESEATNDYEAEDVVGNGRLFDALGVGLGTHEMYNIALTLKKLGEDPKRGVQNVRFFGKFFGLYADYYVFETTINDMPTIPEAPEGSVPYEDNTGTNEHVYFVCNYLGGPMTQLPIVTPDQIKAARLLKKLLTGRLDSLVSTYPLFPGNEANYLRAQIARIACTTVLAPNGQFTTNDENEPEPNEEFEGLPGRDLAETSNWVHKLPHIKKQGRCVVHKREEPEDDENFEFTEEEQEEGPEPLTSVEDDTPIADGSPAWTPLYSSSNEGVKYQVGGLRSNLWPGAYVSGKDKQSASIYVGWGIKNAPFVPLPPPDIAQEFDQALVESLELPPKPEEPEEKEEEEEN